MKIRNLLIVLFAAAMPFWCGCGSLKFLKRGSKPAPAAVLQPAAPQPQKEVKVVARLEDRLSYVEGTVFTLRKLQVRLERDMLRSRERLTANEAEVVRLEQRCGELGRQIEAANTEAAQLRAELIARRAAAEIPALEARIAEEQRRLTLQQTIIEQRNKEIEDLRRALAQRDEMLKSRPRSETKPVAPQPAPAVPDKAAQPAKPAPQPAPAPAAPAVPATPAIAPAKPAAPLPVFDPNVPVQDLIARGNARLKAGEIENAEQEFRAALQKDPRATAARFGLASCRYTAGDLAEARRLVDEVRAAEPRNAEALGLAGIIAWRQGDLRAADKLVSAAIKRDPKSALLRTYMGVIRFSQNKRRHAVQELNKAIELDRNFAQAHFNMAYLLATDKPPQLEKARVHYGESLRLGCARDEKLERVLNP